MKYMGMPLGMWLPYRKSFGSTRWPAADRTATADIRKSNKPGIPGQICTRF